MTTRKASIKETGEELSQADWERFDAAVAAAKTEREATGSVNMDRAPRNGEVRATRTDPETPSLPVRR